MITCYGIANSTVTSYKILIYWSIITRKKPRSYLIMTSLTLFSISNYYNNKKTLPLMQAFTQSKGLGGVKLSPSPSILKCWPIRSPPLKSAICWARPSLSPSGQMKLPSGALSVSHARLPLLPPLLWIWQISVHCLSHYTDMWWWTENCWWKVVLDWTL